MNNDNDIVFFKLLCINCTSIVDIYCYSSILEKLSVKDDKFEFICPTCGLTLYHDIEYADKEFNKDN